MTDWKHAGRAARLGAICALGPSLILFGRYYAFGAHLGLSIWLGRARR